MNKRFLSALIIISSILFVGCGSSVDTDYDVTSSSYYAKDTVGFTESATADYDYGSNEYEVDDYEYSESSSESEVDLSGYDVSRKLIYNSNISLETKSFDDDVNAIKELVASNGGYFENTSTYGNVEYGGRSAYFTARIPSDKYDSFMNSVGDVGSLTSKNESVNDITSSYVDVQARLSSLNTKLDRLRELESQAENVTELLEIEDRINEVQYQLESYTAQMKVYDNQVDYSTVNIDINEVVTYTEVKADSAWNRFVEAFVDSFSEFVSFLQGFVIAIIYLLPYLIIVVIVALIIFVVRRRKGKKGLPRVRKKDDDGKD